MIPHHIISSYITLRNYFYFYERDVGNKQKTLYNELLDHIDNMASWLHSLS